MCLSVAVHRPNDVLAHFTHAGHECMVVHNRRGYRCGYCKVDPGHPWHGKDYGDIDCQVHGQLTFAEADLPCGKGGEDNGFWVGFDCGHSGDAPDPNLPSEYSRSSHVPAGCFPPGWEGEVRTQEYVEAECRSLAEQAAAVVGLAGEGKGE